MKLTDPVLGGKLRLLIVVITATLTVLSAIQDTAALPWVASLSVALTTVLGVLTHLTTIGNVEGGA
jgi:hypothetical protein